MCAMYYYASKLTAAALSGGGSFGGGGGGGGGSGGAAVCRCHETRKEQQQQQSPRRGQQQPQPARHHSGPSRVSTPTLGPTTSENVVVEHPRLNHYHRHRTKHKVCSLLLAISLSSVVTEEESVVPWYLRNAVSMSL